MKSHAKFIAGFIASAANRLFYHDKPVNGYSESAFHPREASIRNPKDSIKKASIERNHKAQKLSQLSKAKRRAVYYFNLRHLVKMYAVNAGRA